MKRRRTDNPGPSTSQIAESNNTLRFLAGRHNRWMSGGEANGQWQTAPAGNAAVDLSAVRSNATSASHADGEVRAVTNTAPSTNEMLDAAGLRPEPPPSTSTPTPRTAPSSGPALVQYESPQITATGLGNIGLPTPAGNGNGRKSADVMARHTGQPSLPSPASSDDSPTFAAQSLQRGRPSLSHSRSSTGAMTAGIVRPMVNSPLAAHQPSPLQQQPMARQAPLPGHPPPTPPVHQHQHQHQHQQILYGQGFVPQQHHGQPQYRHSISGGMQVQPDSPQAPNQPLRTPVVPSNSHGPRQLLPSRIPQEQLLTTLATKEAQMKQAGLLSPTDAGRIALLRDAVQRGDWFYQVLHQLFCLRTVSRQLLPQSLGDVNDKCWDSIAILICSNDRLDRELVEFFSSFPESIMAIYSTDAREIYEARVQAVKGCLNSLPAHWDRFVNGCKDVSAPPLVQDLSHMLQLKTPVLQSTAFRAIARMLYGGSELEAKGVQAVERLHHIDQETYLNRGYRRNPLEMQQAYQVLHSVFKAWQQHLQRHISTSPFPDFLPPPFAVNFFKQPPPSQMPAAQQSVHAHRPSVQLQHQQMFNGQPVNPHFQAQTQAPNGRSSPISPQVAQMPPQLAQLASLGRQLQAGRSALQSPTTPNRPSKLLFPRVEDQPRAQPTNPDWTRSGLHQTHLRSPDLGPVELRTDSPPLYRYVVGFRVPPTKLKKSIPTQTFTFNMSGKAIDRIAKTDAPQTTGQAPYRRITEHSSLYRLRCAVVPKGGFPSESAWVTADNIWPEDMYFELNGKQLEIRRKLHHGRYLPIDLSSLLRVGENMLKVSRTRRKEDFRSHECALAIESVGVLSHDSIKDSVHRIPATESLSAIKKSLAGADGGDDELAVTSSALTIKLFDPYSGCKIFDVPVRGSNCLHRDCFDLETFLKMCKRQHSGWPTVVDCWRCPLCRGDVRPQMLVVDEFLVEVRQELGKQGLLDTRAIIVNPDGSWKPKPEEATGVRSASLEREERGSMPRPSSTTPAPKRTIEVVELD